MSFWWLKQIPSNPHIFVRSIPTISLGRWNHDVFSDGKKHIPKYYLHWVGCTSHEKSPLRYPLYLCIYIYIYTYTIVSPFNIRVLSLWFLAIELMIFSWGQSSPYHYANHTGVFVDGGTPKKLAGWFFVGKKYPNLYFGWCLRKISHLWRHPNILIWLVVWLPFFIFPLILGC